MPEYIDLSKANDKKFTVHSITEVTWRVTWRRVADLLTGAFEGGSNYWIEKVTKVGSKSDMTVHSDPELGRKSGQGPVVYLADWVLNEKTSLIFGFAGPFDESGKTQYELDVKKIEAGLATFLKGEGWGKDADGNVVIQLRHAHNFLMENDDAETADVFLQICLFGEVVFG